RQLRRLHVTDDSLRLAHKLSQLRITGECFAPRVPRVGRVTVGAYLHLLAATCLLDLAEGFDEIGGALVQGLITSDERIRRLIVDPLGRQLRRDPAVDASGAYSLCVAGARSKTQTIEYLLHLLVREELSQLGRHNDNGLG